jgi:hypothetical protein
MKGFVFVTAAVLASALLPWTPAASGHPGVHEFAVGGGTETFQGRTLHFAFSAHKHGSNPATGHVVLKDVAPAPLFTGGHDRIAGRVQCLSVDGNRANIVFTVKKTNSTDFFVGEQIVGSLQDNGNPNNPANPDKSGWFASSVNPGAVPLICSGGVMPGTPGGVVTQGNVVVKTQSPHH